MRVLIIAKSRRGDGFSLIGFVNETQQIIRILNSNGEYFPKDTQFETNSVWDMDYKNKQGFKRPHVEDVIIEKYELIGKLTDFNKVIFNRVPKYDQGFSKIFDGYLKQADDRFLTIDNYGTLPVNSLEAMISEFDFVYDPEISAYKFTQNEKQYFLKYSGSENPQDIIPEGSFVVFELSPWITENGKEIAYLELTAWYSDKE